MTDEQDCQMVCNLSLKGRHHGPDDGVIDGITQTMCSKSPEVGAVALHPVLRAVFSLLQLLRGCVL